MRTITHTSTSDSTVPGTTTHAEPGSLAHVSNDVIRKHMPMVRRMARQLIARLPPNIENDDLIQVGLLAVASATARFTEEKSSLASTGSEDPDQAFNVFAKPRIAGAMLDLLRADDMVSRKDRKLMREIGKARNLLEHEGIRISDEAVATRVGVTQSAVRKVVAKIECALPVDMEDLDTIAEEPPADQLDSVQSSLERKKRIQRLETCMDGMSDRQRRIMHLRHVEDLSWDEIGASMGVTASRVNQIHAIAMNALTVRVGALEQRARPAPARTTFTSDAIQLPEPVSKPTPILMLVPAAPAPQFSRMPPLPIVVEAGTRWG